MSSCCTLSYVDSETIAVLHSVFEGRYAMSSVMQKILIIITPQDAT